MDLANALLYPSLYITSYVTTCFILNHYQSELVRLYMISPLYKSCLRYVTIVHNICLILFSAYIGVSITHAYLYNLQAEPYVMNLCWAFTYSKIWEFLDTYLILLKGQSTIFLQKYHHIGALLCWWLLCYYNSPVVYQPTALNAFIHTIMYSYYLASLLGYKWIACKPYITSLQLLQFFGGTYISVMTYIIPTIEASESVQDLLEDRAFLSTLFFYVYLTGLVYLFLQFFYKEYCGKRAIA